MNQTSNSNMPRSTVETLKQIQKQGLSISIVSPDSARSSFSLDPSVSKETKPIVTLDKTPKLPTRSSVAPESKATISQIKSIPNSSPEARAPGGQSTPQSSFQDAKLTGSITKSVNSSVTGSETRAFGSQSWSKSALSVTTENKAQGASNQPLESKTSGGAGRITQNSTAFSENKVLNTRTVSNTSQVVTDNKSQGRISQIATVSESKNQGSQSRNQNQLTFEGKLQTGQGRVTINSPPLEVKTINSNQDNSTTTSVTPAVSTMSTPRGTGKRPQGLKVVNSSPVAKKRCAKRASPSSEACGKPFKNLDSSLNSADASPKEKQFFHMKGLTITPVGGSSTPVANPSTSGNATKASVAGNTVTSVVSCPTCQQISVNPSVCDRCNSRIPSTAQQIPLSRRGDAPPAFVVTKNVTTSIQKQIVFQFQDQTCVQFQQNVKGKVMVETNQSVSPRTKGRARGRRKFEEPVVYTLSSDEEEPTQVDFHPALEGTHPQFYGDSEGSKSEHSSTSEVLQDDNLEFEDPQYPGVTDINEQIEVEEEPDEEEEEMEFETMQEDEMEESLDEDEEEEIPPEEPEPEGIRGQKPTDYPMRCRSIRIGSYKIHPLNNFSHIPVCFSTESISFRVPILYEPNKFVNINLRNQDIRHVLAHFGRCLPIMFVFTSNAFGEAVRAALRMNSADDCYFDPSSKNDKIQKITFLIDSMTDEHRNFIRHCFPGDKKVKEIDQKEANEILVKSTPNQYNATTLTKLQVAPEQPTVQITPAPQVTAQKIIPPQPPQPVIKLLTYPPPPQTGGIAITTEDLHCLNDGEFLNDAIIDFYLKFIFNEKLSASQREKTHIFSSFFYPRLTHKPERPRFGDETTKNIQARRHNQVKTWTRHVDIFSKDFIIIPVNQNVHWFLAIICYPGKVPEVPESVARPEVKNNKTSDNVSSTVEQESTGGTKLTIRELSNNGEGDSLNQDENSASSVNSTYLVEEPPDSDEPSPEAPDSTTHPDGKQRKEMPCICIFDSLSGPNRWRILAALREYLEMEWKLKKGTKKVFDRNTMQGFVMKCPQQTNFSDCGTYLLQFMESFFENPIPYFGNPMPDLTNWFSELKISKKRQQLKDLIISIHRKQLETSNARKSKPPDGVQTTPVTVQQSDNR